MADSDSSNTESLDHPFDEVAMQAEQIIHAGGIVYFKFTCQKCGARQTFDVPNKLYTHGNCEECGTTSSLVDNGCNFLVVWQRS